LPERAAEKSLLRPPALKNRVGFRTTCSTSSNCVDFSKNRILKLENYLRFSDRLLGGSKRENETPY
jgi:hypothetical protein